MTYREEKRVAIHAVKKAAELCESVRTELVGAGALEKADKSPVTVADFGSQALVCRDLQTAFPQDLIVAEEDATELRKPGHARNLDQVTNYVRRFHPSVTPEIVCMWIDAGQGCVSERFWTLDPIDGTKGFLRNDQYAIALALVENGQVRVGALACPNLPYDFGASQNNAGVVLVAVEGEPALMASLGGGALVPIQVAPASEALMQRFVESVEAAHGNQSLQSIIAQRVGIQQPALRMDSQAKYAAVARGDASLYLRLPSPETPDYREKIWDHAAGTLIVEAAGGRVTDINGQPLDFAADRKMHKNRGVVATNDTIHSAVLEALQTAGV